MLRIRFPRAAQGAMTALALLAVAAAAAASPATPVATGDPLDPLTPMLGNRGYDVLGTTITLEVDVAAGSIVSGSAAILAEATAPIDRVTFDFRDGLATDAVAVDGRPAEFVHRSDDLVVDLPEALHPGEPFTVDVRYHGTPGGHPEAFERGWWADGESVFIVGEPGGAEAWFPANNHPSDAAVFTLVLAVPEGVETVAGGRLVSTRADGPRTVTRWSHDKPIPAYLLTFAAGDLDIVQREIGDVGITLAFPPDFSDDRRAPFDRLPDILGCLESWYGDYPSDRFGAVVVDDFSAALETEGMSVFGRAAVNEATIAHELAHHWFGNDVRLASWQDIWLNEGFGRYAEVLWAECADGPAGRQRALAPVADAVRGGARAPARHAPIGDPASDALFDGQVYNRGALTLDALRRELGDEAFRRLLIAWHDTHAGEAVVTADFIALASGIAGRDLTGWFEPWLEETDLPPGMPEPPPATTPVG